MSTTEGHTRFANRTVARLATVGLGAVLLFLGGFGIWAAVSGSRDAQDLERTQLLSSAYDRLRNALDDERLVEHEEALGHHGNFDTAARRSLAKRFEAAAGEVDAALADVRRKGSASDLVLVGRISRVQRRYREAMMALFAAKADERTTAAGAVDARTAGDDGATMSLGDGHMAGEGDAAASSAHGAPDPDGADPNAAVAEAERRVTKLQTPLMRLQGEIKRTDRGHSLEDLQRLRSLDRTSDRTLALTLAAFPLALLLFGVFASVLRGYRRRLEQANRAELARLEQIALTDNLTGVRNHRAFHEDLSRELTRAERSGTRLTLVLLDMDDLKQVNDRFGHQQGDDQLRALAACMVETVRDSDVVYRIGGDEFALILAGENALGALRVTQRLLTNLSGTRVNRPSARAGIAETSGPVSGDELVRKADLALYDAKRSGHQAVVYARGLEKIGQQEPPTSERTERHLQILATTLARAVDLKDSATRSHCETVAELSARLAEELGLDPERVVRLRMAGLLHDIGKIGISDAILQKPGPLTAEEYEVMKTHVALGSGILAAAGLHDEAFWILHHHERLDGDGYPSGLAGTTIPLESRILFVADAFEAITGERPYRRAQPDDLALAELDRNAGTQFDPDCVAALRRLMADGAARPPTGAPRHPLEPLIAGHIREPT
jgi:diguanylate cyclase (GGDEF)-like protein/putative nucleotidyltransferase with HDIG domain